MSAKFIKIAHRGASGTNPENTLISFKNALNCADMIEFDVHLTKDGHLIIFHDDTLERVTASNGKISDKTLAELKSLAVLGKEKIPTLAEALVAIDRKLPVDIELKGKNTAKKVADTLKEFLKKGWNYSDFLISSFDHEQVYEFNRYLPEVKTAFLYWQELPTEKEMKEIRNNGIDWLILDSKTITQKFIKEAQKLGFEVGVYTVDDACEYQKLKSWGVNGIATDFPEKF
ncbi:hypothetical protein A3F66_03185 [candidate division TM6 bacterium RIFCSPHIGHO2_12_FULL_32_22]|nr:MAG: hypothetical protein A3F66_03185 [candidate division TM6 bacterium RIFCSPHIGHO2_12_FULL_32_22]